MSPSAELLDQALTTHGDMLYRVALLLGGDERSAATLLLACVRESIATWNAAPPARDALTEPVLLAALADAARAADVLQRPSYRRVRRTRATSVSAIGQLPLEQRLILALVFLCGYDVHRSAAVIGGDTAQVHDSLIDAIRALGPVAGHTLTDAISGVHCLPMRAMLVDDSAGPRQAAAVRAHLAACASCRRFDLGWGEICRELEAAVRAPLRDRTLPLALAARLHTLARPQRRHRLRLRLALAPLAVLVLLAALVVPGFFRTPVRVVSPESGPTINPERLLAMAMERHATPPDGAGVWYSRVRTGWYLNEDMYAPLIAEAWLDPRNPARHRLQLTPTDDSAPYEFQLGTGRDQLYYALAAIYAPTLYGHFPTQPYPQSPALLTQIVAPEGQQRARDERLASGPWSLPTSYLRQAQAASDLRVLGRQPDGDRTVVLLSFSGISPLGLPPDSVDGARPPVTILLAFDAADGLLRSATELLGPPGAEQVSRVTWRIEEERSIDDGQQLSELFAIDRAWTGRGRFSERASHQVADPALPMIAATAIDDPFRLLAPGSLSYTPLWLPAQRPNGVDRALIVWPRVDAARITVPHGVVYLGPGRRLLITYQGTGQVAGEAVREGVWEGALRPGPGRHYRLHLSRSQDERLLGSDLISTITIDAFGFSRDEVLAVVRSLEPMNVAVLIAQDELFLGRAGDPHIRSLLLQAVHADITVPEGHARYLQVSSYSRQSPPLADERRDPYHGPRYDGQPETVQINEWLTNQGGPARYTETRALEGDARYGQSYLDATTSWYTRPQVDVAYGYPSFNASLGAYLPSPARAAFEMLTLSGGAIALENLSDGRSIIRVSQPTQDSARYYHSAGTTPFFVDLQPITLTTELQLNGDGETEQVTLVAEDADRTRTVVQRYTVEERRDILLDAAPAALRTGEMPQAAYTADFRELNSWTEAPLATRTLTETLARHTRDIYILDSAPLQYVQDAPPGPPLPFHGGHFMEPVIAQGLALRLVYTLPSTEGAGPSGDLRLNQGPAVPLRAWLRSLQPTPWQSSEPVRLMANGRVLDAWLASGDREYLCIEIDDTLIVADGPPGWFAEDGAAILASLRLATWR